VRGNHAYLGQGDDGVQVVDISNPNDPAVVGNVSAWAGAGQIDIIGDRAYVARVSNGFGILGLTNPAAPVALGGYDTVGYTYETALLPGGRLAVADGFDGTSVFDISTPASPVELGSYDSDPYRLVALDERVFLVAGQGMAPQIRLGTFQSPVAPAVLANIDFDGQSVAVSVGAGHAMVANSSGGLVMLDTTNPAQPAYI